MIKTKTMLEFEKQTGKSSESMDGNYYSHEYVWWLEEAKNNNDFILHSCSISTDLNMLMDCLTNYKFGKPAIIQHIIQELIAILPALYDKYDKPYNGMPERKEK